MSIAYACVLAAALLPYAFTGIAKWSSDFDNRVPREYLSRLSGYRQRAHWVQLNAFETFPVFAAAVIIAQERAAPQPRVDALALAFVAARALYGVCYLADLATPRTLVWMASMGIVVALFFS